MSESNNDESNDNELNEKIGSLRQKFLNSYNEDNDRLYDDCDVRRVQKCDWLLKRYLLAHNCNQELALNNLKDTLEWRKSFGVNQRTDAYFPDDFYKIGGLFQYNCDKTGLPLLYIRICVHRKVQELAQLVKEFFVHKVNQIDVSSGGQWVLVFDCTASGLSNVDMDFSRFMIDVLQNYFPKSYKYVIIYEMPWLLATFWKISRMWLSEEDRQQIKLASGQEIFTFIDAKQVPQHIQGGQCLQNIYRVPDGVLPAEQLKHLKFTEEQIRHFRTVFNIQQNDDKSEYINNN
ncbi:motile sperm domain-containing protein 2-like [Oppia nitens]|uniref:motile sperm domain-containing protein 2-like n=1 Tax=Oppia nitens TaxID=1686743 RepID=UPI0023DBE366|nr:motile sperm domain-containing protein 2-like [Oppia nitens]